MQIGNTQTPVRFRLAPDDYLARWFAEAPTHHCALAVGHNAGLYAKAGELLGIAHVTIA
jgi:L-arabinose isomerase